MADPICTFLFSIFVLCTTFTIMRDIIIVLMEGRAFIFLALKTDNMLCLYITFADFS